MILINELCLLSSNACLGTVTVAFRNYALHVRGGLASAFLLMWTINCYLRVAWKRPVIKEFWLLERSIYLGVWPSLAPAAFSVLNPDCAWR